MDNNALVTLIANMRPVQNQLTMSVMFEFLQAKIGRGKDCESALQRLRGNNADISEESAEIRVMFLLPNDAYDFNIIK